METKQIDMQERSNYIIGIARQAKDLLRDGHHSSNDCDKAERGLGRAAREYQSLQQAVGEVDEGSEMAIEYKAYLRTIENEISSGFSNLEDVRSEMKE